MIAGLILATLGAEHAAEAAQKVETANQIVQMAGEFGIKPWLLLAQIVNFALVAAILYFLVLKPIEKKLDERAKLIDEGLRRSEESQQILDAARAQEQKIVGEARHQAQGLVERAQKEIEEFVSAKRTEAAREATELLEKTTRSLANEQQIQIAKAQRQIAQMVVSLAEKSLEETLTEEQKARFAERVAQGMQT